MTFVRVKERQIDLNLVYFGPPGAGKRTSLEYIHGRVFATRRSEIFVERRESFEEVSFFLLGSTHKGYQIRFWLKTATGDDRRFAFGERMTFFKWVDGVVFVGDARPERRAANETYWKNLKRILAAHGFAETPEPEKTQRLPLAVQWNRVDGPESMLPPAEFRANERKTGVAPFQLVPTVASRGRGVFLPFQNCVRLMAKNLYRTIGK